MAFSSEITPDYVCVGNGMTVYYDAKEKNLRSTDAGESMMNHPIIVDRVAKYEEHFNRYLFQRHKLIAHYEMHHSSPSFYCTPPAGIPDVCDGLNPLAMDYEFYAKTDDIHHLVAGKCLGKEFKVFCGHWYWMELEIPEKGSKLFFGQIRYNFRDALFSSDGEETIIDLHTIQGEVMHIDPFRVKKARLCRHFSSIEFPTEIFTYTPPNLVNFSGRAHLHRY